MKDKAQGRDPDISTDTQVKGVELSDDLNRPDGSDKNFSDSNGDEQEATEEQLRPLRRLIKLLVLPIRYGWKYICCKLVFHKKEIEQYKQG